MTAEKKEKKPLTAGALEAEADQDRHALEEDILRTAASGGPDNPFRLIFADAYAYAGKLNFTRTDHRAIADALVSCIMDRVAADFLLLKDKLKAAGAEVDDEVLRGILDGSKAKDRTVAEKYLEKIERQDIFRRAKSLVPELEAELKKAEESGASPDTALAGVMKKLWQAAQTKRLVREHHPEAEEMLGFLEELKERRSSTRKWTGLDSGFKHLNEVLNGLTAGVYVFAGAPSCGKTTLLKQIADHVAEEEAVPVLFFSFEQSAEELRIKSLARGALVNSRDIWKGTADEEQWAEVEKASSAFMNGAGRHLTIVEAGREDTLDHIRLAALGAKLKAGDDRPILLVVDYLQIIPAGDARDYDSIREKVDWHLSELRRLSRELNSPVLVISSENRAAYAGNEKPSLSALKESGGIEYSADAVICLWHDSKESAQLTKDDPSGLRVDRVVLLVLKNRNGELASINLNFTPAHASFVVSTTSAPGRITWDEALGKKEK